MGIYNSINSLKAFIPLIISLGLDGAFIRFFHEYKKDGSMVLETLHPFGASSKPGNKHFTDQMEIYANQQTKTMTLNREEIFKNAEKVYHPK